MNESQKILGACVRVLREQNGLSQENLAVKAGISYQYLSGVETGKENFSIQVLESLATSLGLPVRALVATAYDNVAGFTSPRLEPKYFRPQVPLPEGLTIHHIEAAANLTQSIIHRINRNMTLEIGQTLQSLIQGNNFSGLVSNVFSNAMNECSPYKHNHDQKYPDLVRKKGDDGAGIGLEVKTTINIGKGGESHNGHSGWHVIACYNFVENGDIRFIHLMFASLNGHQHSNPDWSYVGSKVNSDTGSRRTETYVTTLAGTTKLRDGSVYMDSSKVNFTRWRQARDSAIPPWSIFARNNPI
ncbi:MAG: helix-turn-helix domain-containing protein [Zoogloeaceae bacterium]|jgi:transcriptional regulator with XRE-family HTH domain|nr:helix-turn-helix domain-containing protein [Zoogloeaceae bacterium]